LNTIRFYVTHKYKKFIKTIGLMINQSRTKTICQEKAHIMLLSIFK